MDKCEKCGMNLNDDCIVVWKCRECGKAFKISFSKLHKIQELKKQKSGQYLIKCSSCGYTLEDGNEKIVCKCSSCGNVFGGNLAYFAGDNDRTNRAEIDLSNSYPDMIECPECGRKILSDSKICSYCGFPVGKTEEKVSSIKCPECNREIRPDVDECPFCGYPMKKKLCIPNFVKGITHLRKRFFIAIISTFLLVILCTSIYVYQGRKHDLDEKSADGTSILESLDVGMQKEEESVESSINDFFTNLQTGNWEKTQEYLTEKYDYLDQNPFGLSTENNLKKLFEHYSFTLIDSTVNDEKDTAFINVDVRHPKQKQLLDAGIANFNFDEENSIENGFMNKLSDSDLEYEITRGSLNLVMVNGEWRIEVDSFFDSCIFYGLSEESSFAKIAENKKKRAEEESYIREMIDLVDYRIGMMNGYSGTVPGINNISIKNNGDKQIDSLILGLDFFDENGVELFSREITVLGILDDPILSGYSWKMERDSFFEIENLPNDIDLDQVAVSINDVQLSDSKITMQKTPEEEYIVQYIEITNYYVGMQNGYRGKEPGISDISIKNNGDKNIAQLTITVYFQDENGKNIAEDSFMIIGGLFGGDTLKANYSWKMESNKYYEFKNLADEVDISRNSIKVTEVKFE